MRGPRKSDGNFRRRSSKFAWTAAALVSPLVLVGITSASGSQPFPGQRTPASSDPSSPAQVSLSSAELAQLSALPNSVNNAGDPLGLFQAKLETDFPDNFGGLFENPDGSFSIVEVGSSTPFESEATALASAVPAEMHKPSAAFDVSFVSGTRTLAKLYAIQKDIMSISYPSIDSYESAGQVPRGVWGTGIDTGHNQVVVYTTTDVGPSSQDVVPNDVVQAAAYGSSIRMTVGPVPSNDSCSRTCDFSPFNMGDEIVTNRSTNESHLVACTSGANVYIPAFSGTYALTAGHCLYDQQYWTGNNTIKWWNTDWTQAVENSSTLFGSRGPYTVSGIDTGLISTKSYGHLMWVGSTTTQTTDSITGSSNPPVGATVDNEGFNGARSGTVTAVNVPWTTCDYDFSPPVCDNLIDGIDSTASIVGGDSGGPLLYPSIFGPLDGGTLVSPDNGTGSMSEEINALLYVWTSYYGTTVELCDATDSCPS